MSASQTRLTTGIQYSRRINGGRYCTGLGAREEHETRRGGCQKSRVDQRVACKVEPPLARGDFGGSCRAQNSTGTAAEVVMITAVAVEEGAVADEAVGTCLAIHFRPGTESVSSDGSKSIAVGARQEEHAPMEMERKRLKGVCSK